MELVSGETLRGPLPIEQALEYASQIASSLDADRSRHLGWADSGNGGLWRPLDSNRRRPSRSS